MSKKTPVLGDFHGRDHSTDISQHTDPYGVEGFQEAGTKRCGNLPGKTLVDAEEYMAKLYKAAEELNSEERRRECTAQDLCDYIVGQWRAVGSANRAVEIPGGYTIESLIRARELFLKLPENLNCGYPKVDFYMTMSRKGGNPYIILCDPGTVV